MRREEQLDEREITGDLGGWLVRSGKDTAADAPEPRDEADRSRRTSPIVLG